MEKWLGALSDRRVCVTGSGDNYAAFAQAGCGVVVTSVDFSREQLAVAEKRAAALGLSITFVAAAVTDMAPIADEQFDLVCSTNGVFVWIAKPGQVFSEVHRILRPGGFYITCDIHPFLRPWGDRAGPLTMSKPYWDTGPFLEKGSRPTYEFHWTLADLLNPLVASGMLLRWMGESPAQDSRFWEGGSYEPGTDDRPMDWRHNPRAGLPVWLTVVAQRP